MERKIKYNLEALKGNLERCDKNIALFQDAIRKEYEMKARLQELINEIKLGEGKSGNNI